jgi:alginate O-acetyltransferase complex protein AlgJ
MQSEIARSVALAQSRPWRISPWFVMTVFAALMLAPLTVQALRVGAASDAEKRQLAAPLGWSDLKKLKRLSRRLESYVNDHFGFRSELVRANSLMRYRIGASSNPQVAIGRDGWLFYTREHILEQHVGTDVFKPDELEEWTRRMEGIQVWLARRGIPLVVVLAPDKNTIYPELLPQFPKPPGTVTRADQVAERLRRGPLPFIDPRAAIMAAKREHPRLYFEGDTHWGHRAAFITYEMLMQELRGRFPVLSPLRLDNFNALEQVVSSDLVYLLGLQNDITVRGEVLSRKEPAPSRSVQIRQPVAGSGWGWPISFHETAARANPRALIFGDSFTDYILGPAFLYDTMRDPVFTHHNTVTLNFNLIDEVKPDVVIIAVAERYLRIMPGPPPAN